MAVLRGFAQEAVLGKESTWGTAPATGQTLPILSESLASRTGTIEVPLIRGNILQPPSVQGLKSVAGTARGILGYEGYEALLVAALGDVSTTDNGDGTYTHVMSLANPLAKSISLWVSRGPRTYGFYGLKVNSLTLSAEAALDGGLVEWEADLVGKDFNSDTSLPATITADAGPPYVALDQLAVLIGDQADALASGDAFYPSSVELKLENNLAGEHYTAGQDTILEPYRNGFPKVTLTLGFARFEDTSTNPTENFRDWMEAKTALQATLTFTYDSSHILTITLGNLRVVDGADPTVAGPEIQGLEVTLQAFVEDTVYDNPNMTTAFQVSLKNTVSTAW